LTLSASSLAFGNVTLKSPATQSLVLKSTGTAPLTISAAKLSGTGFSMSGVSFPVTLAPNQAATLEVEFDPTTAGAVTGALTLSTNAATATTTVAVSGTGESTASSTVSLSWDAPSGSVAVSGYNVYRTVSGSSSYTLLNGSVDTETSYDDSTVKSGTTYVYIVESVSTAGVESSPSNTFTVAIP
jgi:hypothetical protein